MRIFGLVGLLVALVIVGLLAKKQLAPIAAPTLPATTSVPGAPAPAAGTAPANAREQSQQMQQQYKQAIDAAMQPQRKMPEDN
ncbi:MULTISPECIES: hypothetical protein [unclassified Variovorax]|jgi:hypothetical protein|uniref:hypothetical protein n=1 Tax=unclassified Variovorax TaxID=663243 RepID=UPI002B22EB29|nr:MULTISPECIES: hypothetical protein [unclassified Variovorax]MEB0055827.1 hypothetical protein [Variovorax sp. LG9.2]MEB0112737.1 hypothetical protein [Variovorax sp. RTB1]